MITCSFSNPINLGVDSWAFASSTCDGILETSSSVSLSVSSSSLPSVANGFTHGEIVDSVFLFLIFITLIYRFVFEWIHGIRVRPANKA
jgi:hypothetical protein